MEKFLNWLFAAGKAELGLLFLAALLVNIGGHGLVDVGWVVTGYALEVVSALVGGAVAVLLLQR